MINSKQEGSFLQPRILDGRDKKVNKMKSWLSIFLCIWALGLQAQSEIRTLAPGAESPPLPEAAPEEPSGHRILVLSSYHLSDRWTSEIYRHILGEFALLEEEYKIDCLEMTTVNSQSLSERFLLMRMDNLLATQSKEGRYDLVVSVLGKAADFIVKHYERFPQDIPILFTGVQACPFGSLSDYPKITGIWAEHLIAENLELGRQLFPSTQEVLVVSDGELLEECVHAHWEKQWQTIPGLRIRLINGTSATTEQLLETVAGLPRNSFVIFSSWRRSTQDGFPSIRAVIDQIRERSLVPIFVTRNDFMVRGVLGGHVMDATLYGEETTSLMKEIFNTPEGAELPHRSRPACCLINEPLFKELHLKKSLLPKWVTFHNRMPGFWELYRREALCVIGGFVLFLFMVALLARAHQIRKREAKKTAAILGSLPLRIVIVGRNGKIFFQQTEKELYPDGRKPRHVREMRGLNTRQIEKAIEQIFKEKKGRIISCKFGNSNRIMVMRLIGPEIYGEEAVLWFSQDISELAQERQKRRELEKQSRVLLESIADGLIATDTKGEITYFNPAAAALIGYSEEEALGQPIADVYHAVSCLTGQPTDCPVQQVLSSGAAAQPLEHVELITRHGFRRQIAGTATPVFGLQKKMEGVVFAFRDVTREFQQRQRLNFSLELLRFATHLAHLSYFSLDESFETVAHPIGNQTQNWGKDENGKPLPPQKWVYWEDYEEFMEKMRRLRSREVNSVQFSFRSDYTGQMKHYLMLAAWRKSPLEEGSQRVFGLLQDVTQINLGERKYNEANELLRQIMDVIPSPLFVKDANNGFRYEMVNQRFAEKIAQRPAEEILGKNDFELFADSEIAAFLRSQDVEAILKNKPHSFLERLRGSWLQMVKSTFLTVDGRRLLIGFGIDVTELEELRIKEEETRILLESVLNHAPIGISVKDADDDYRYFIWSKEMERITGLPPEKILGKNDFDFLEHEEAQEIRNWDLRALETGVMQDFLRFHTGPDGEQVAGKICKVLMKTESGRRLIINTNLDVTRRMGLEDERLQLISQLNQHVESAQTINQCLQVAITGQNFNETIEEILKLLGRQMKAGRCYLIRYDLDQMTFSKTHEWSAPGTRSNIEAFQNLTLDSSHEFYQKLQRGEDLLIEDAEQCMEPGAEKGKDFWVTQQQVKSLLVTGLWLEERLWGCLGVDFTFGKRQFNDSDIVLVHDTVSVLHLAQERFQMLFDLEKHVQNTRVLNRCLQKVVVSGDLKLVIEDVLGVLGRSLRADYCNVLRYEEDYEYCCSVYEWMGPGIAAEKRVDWEPLKRFPSDSGIVELQKKRIHIEFSGMENMPVEFKESEALFEKLGIQSLSIAGIWINQKLWGSMGFAFLKKRRFTRSDSHTMRGATHLFQLAYERNRQMQQIAESHHFQKQMFDNIGVPLLMMDKERKIVIATASFAELLGVPYEKLIGSTCNNYFCHLATPFNCQSESCPIQIAFTRKEKLVRSVEYKGRYYQASVQPIFDLDGELLYVLESLVDITEIHENQQRLEEAMKAAQAADRAKSIFLSTMSHEIRTPLNAIIGLSEALQDINLQPAEEKDYLHSIHLSGNTLLNLVNNVLDLSKVEADESEFVPVPTDVAGLLEEVHAIFRNRATEKGLDLQFFCPKLLPLFQLDPARLKQVLLNLISNALKFTHKGNVRIRLEFEPVNQRSCLLSLSVADTGIGISQEFQRDIFEPFQRQQDREARGHYYEGSGLGLSITKQLVEKMGGEIFLKSSPDEGSTFTVRFPGIEYEYRTQLTDSTSAWVTDGYRIRSGLRVLLVDDVEVNLKVLSIMLKKLNVEHRLASSGKQALAEFEKSPFDVVLTDLWMPEMSGEELAAALRATTAGSKIKIIAITADIEAEAGFDLTHLDGVLYKPVVRSKLLKLLSEL